VVGGEPLAVHVRFADVSTAWLHARVTPFLELVFPNNAKIPGKVRALQVLWADKSDAFPNDPDWSHGPDLQPLLSNVDEDFGIVA
jgi:hypothetical protein